MCVCGSFIDFLLITLTYLSPFTHYYSPSSPYPYSYLIIVSLIQKTPTPYSLTGHTKMSFRPKTAQAQRPEPRQESSIPIPRTKSIPSLRRQLTQGIVPPMPLGNSRTQSQIPAPRQLGISRKPSIPLRSGLAHVPTLTQVTRKVSTTRLRSAPILPPMVGREREKKPLPTRSGLDLSKTFDSNLSNPNAPRGQSIKRQAPVSPSINSVPIVNRLNRKASIPIIARATYITPPGLKFGRTNMKEMEEKRDEDIFQGGPSIIEPTQPKQKDGIQKMMMRGNKIERPDYLGQGQELQDMSIDLNGMSVHLYLISTLISSSQRRMIRDWPGEVLMTRYSFTYETCWRTYQKTPNAQYQHPIPTPPTF